MEAVSVGVQASSPGRPLGGMLSGCMHPPMAAAGSSGIRRRAGQLSGSRSMYCNRRRGRCRPFLVSANGAIVPNMPFPGDDQASTIFTALSELDPTARKLAEAEQEVARTADQLAARLGSGQGTSTAGEALDAASSNGASPGGSQKPPKVPHRWVIVGAMAVAFVLCNMDKVNMSVAVIPMAAELGWSASDRGLVSSAFFWGYSATQIPAGWVSTRIGGARVLLAGVALWSLGTLLAPPAAHMGLLALCASRVFVGLGEGLAPSSATNIMARLVPEGERARAVTAVFGSLDVGSVVGLLICGPLIRTLGWPSVFYLFALLGLAWCLVWPALRPSEADASLPPPASVPSNVANKAVPWGLFLRSRPVWAIIVAHFCYNWGYYTLLAWLPSYFELSLGLNVESSSLLTLIPYLAMTAMTPFVGPIADGLVSKGWSVTNVRKLSQGVAFGGPALCMLACSVLTPAGAAHVAGATPHTSAIVALFSAAFAMGAWARAGLYCNHQDLSPEYAAALLGLSNTAGALPGILGVTSVGFLLDITQSWGASLFYPTAACQVFGMVIYSLFASSERQGWASLGDAKPQEQ